MSETTTTTAATPDTGDAGGYDGDGYDGEDGYDGDDGYDEDLDDNLDDEEDDPDDGLDEDLDGDDPDDDEEEDEEEEDEEEEDEEEDFGQDGDDVEPGEPEPVEVIGHVSDLLAAGQRLRWSDTAPLHDLVGRRAAKALTGRLEQDWREARRGRSWWRRLADQVVPLPDSLADLVVRWQDGEQLQRADQDLMATVVGSDLARRLVPDIGRRRWGRWAR
jgi:hypothetical protein